MAIGGDRVQLLKQETDALGGQDLDKGPYEGPSPIEPQEDAIEAAGVFLQDAANRDEAVYVCRDASDLCFRDENNTAELTLSDLLASGPALFQFGADMRTAGRHYKVHGDPTKRGHAALDEITGMAFPQGGKLVAISVRCENSGSRTLKVLIDGVVVETEVLSGTEDVVALTNETVFLAGEVVAVEYDAGDSLGQGTCVLHMAF